MRWGTGAAKEGVGAFGCGGGSVGWVVVGAARLEESQGAEALVRMPAAADTLLTGRRCGVRAGEGQVFVLGYLWEGDR